MPRFLKNDAVYRLPKPLRTRYKRAGTTRDWQVPLQAVVAQNDSKLPSFSIWLEFRMAEAGKYRRQRNVDLALKALKTELRKEPLIEINDSHFNSRDDAFVTWLKKPVTDGDSDASVREIRKRAKDMLHVACFYRTAIAAETIESGLEQQLRRLANSGGAHHDNARLLQSVQRFEAEYRNELSERAGAALASAIQHWEHDKRKHAANLQETIGALLQPRVPTASAGQETLPH